jgi:hypothetical protein
VCGGLTDFQEISLTAFPCQTLFFLFSALTELKGPRSTKDSIAQSLEPVNSYSVIFSFSFLLTTQRKAYTIEEEGGTMS